MMPQEQPVRVSREGYVATLALAFPEAPHAADPAMAAALRGACDDLAYDDAVRVVLLTGGGEGFCVSTPEGAVPEGEPGAWPRLAATVAAVAKPVIIAINGDAIGHGLELALAGDLRLAADGAKLAMPQVSWGALPWDGGTQRLARAVGRSWALELLLTGRSVTAQEALDIGLVHRVVPRDGLMAQARGLAEQVAGYAPIALGYAKEAVTRGMDLGLLDGLGLEMDLNILLHSTEDRAEGIGSFLERREARFRGR